MSIGRGRWAVGGGQERGSSAGTTCSVRNRRRGSGLRTANGNGATVRRCPSSGRPGLGVLFEPWRRTGHGVVLRVVLELLGRHGRTEEVLEVLEHILLGGRKGARLGVRVEVGHAWCDRSLFPLGGLTNPNAN